MTLPIGLYVVQAADGTMQHLAACLPHEQSLAKGIPPEAILGSMPDHWSAGDPLPAEGFRHNDVFMALMHEVIERYAPNLPGFTEAAREQGEGTLAIIDQRTSTPGGEVPPVDIVGAFKVSGGAVESYHASPNHRLLTEHGFTSLDQHLEAQLVEAIGKHL